MTEIREAIRLINDAKRKINNDNRYGCGGIICIMLENICTMLMNIDARL